METVKIVFDIDTTDVKTSTDDLKALNKVTETEVEALKRLEAESNANKVAFQQLNKELKSANTELLNAKKTFGDTSKEAQSAQKNVDALTDKMAELKTTVKPVEESFVSLRTQLKLAKEEAVKAAEKFGEFSKEANEARAKAGALADQTSDLNRQVNLLNPEAKAKAFSNLASGVVGAFSIATGALQAFGVKNKEVEELAMKLQGALNITQGIASFGALKESLQDIKVVLGFTTAAQETLTVAKEADVIVTNAGTAANRTFIASLAANPIIVAVGAIGALAAAFILLNDQTKTAILNEQELADLKKKTVELKNKEKQAEIDLKVATGELSKQKGEIAKIELKRIEDTEELVKKIAALTAEEKRNLDRAKEKADLDETIGKEALKRANENNEKIAISRKALQEQLDVINKTAATESKQQTIEELNDNKAKNEKLAEQNKAKSEKEKAERERAEKERQQQWDRIFAEMDAEGKLEAEAVEKRNKERRELEKRLVQETNRARLLLVKGNKIAELQVQMDILDEQYAEDILNAQRTGKDVAAINAKYANDQTELNQQVTEAAKEEGDKQLKNKKDLTAEELKIEEKAAAERKAIRDGAFQVAAFAGQAFFEGVARQNDEELAQLEDQKNKKIINEKEYQRRLKEIKNKQAQDAKKQAIYQATLDFSAALINALTFKPIEGVPAALIFASVLAAANLAKIIATPVPKFQKGTLSVPGVDMGRDSVHAMLQPGEAVIPVSTNRAYHPTIKAIYEKKISPSEINNFVMSRTSSAGRQSVTASVDTYALSRALGKNKTVEVGNANMIGRAMAKELLRGQNLRRS
jgi:hypothetical protein